MDSGLAPSGACRAAGRVATGRFWKGQTPTELCPHQGFKTYDYGKTTGIEVEEEEEEKPEEQKPEDQPTNPSVDPETGLPVTPTDPEGGGTNSGGTTDPDTSTEPETPPPDDPEA